MKTIGEQVEIDSLVESICKRGNHTKIKTIFWCWVGVLSSFFSIVNLKRRNRDRLHCRCCSCSANIICNIAISSGKLFSLFIHTLELTSMFPRLMHCCNLKQNVLNEFIIPNFIQALSTCNLSLLQRPKSQYIYFCPKDLQI